MTSQPTPTRSRTEFRNINALSDLPSYRLPLAGWVSILHRISGALIFFLLPLVVWTFDLSVSSEYSHARLSAVFSQGALGLPGAIFKLLALALIWAFLHHLIAGLRHLVMDAAHAVTKEFGRNSALLTLVLSLLTTVLLGAKLLNLY